MGPFLVALVVGLFFAWAALSGVLLLLFSIVAAWRLYRGRNLQALRLIAAGIAGAFVSTGIGFLMQWNIIGYTMMSRPIIGIAAWASIGSGGLMTVAFVLEWVSRRLLNAAQSTSASTQISKPSV